MRSSDHLYFEGVAACAIVPTRPTTPPRTRPTPADLDEVTDEFYAWLFRRAGLSVDRYRGSTLSRRLPACLRALGVRSTDEAKRAIESDPARLHTALDALLLGVSAFFRDGRTFDALRDEVLPALSARGSGFRAWCAACSDGQEPYSLAILLDEAGLLGRCELLGTDCRAEAITRARTGRYSAEALADLDPRRIERYFTPEGPSSFRVRGDLRGVLRWKVADLFAGAEAGPWDLILWRNMAIYLKNDAADALWRKLVGELRPGGYLVVGKADHPPAGLGLRRVQGNLHQVREAHER